MSEQLGDGHDVAAGAQRADGERVPQDVGRGVDVGDRTVSTEVPPSASGGW
jgi:hypothetical protein